jgi:hypothetical protein
MSETTPSITSRVLMDVMQSLTCACDWMYFLIIARLITWSRQSYSMYVRLTRLRPTCSFRLGPTHCIWYLLSRRRVVVAESEKT